MQSADTPARPLTETRSGTPAGGTFGQARTRLRFSVVYLLLLAVVFSPLLWSLAIHGSKNNLHSHVLLIPFVSAYVLWIRWKDLPTAYRSSWFLASMMGALAAAALSAAWIFAPALFLLSHNDFLALVTFSLVCCLAAGGFAFLGNRWMAAAAFPILFLLFMVPLPDAAVDALETASKLGSAETTDLFFSLSGTPFLRSGTVFQLPGIALEVAQECSGIRSSWVLLITSLLASNLFLRTQWRRAVLVLFVIPLGLIRNGFRIMVIGLLCVHIGPEMIHSVIHRRGGPLFFAASLIPLFALAWWLRAGEQKKSHSAVRGSDVATPRTD